MSGTTQRLLLFDIDGTLINSGGAGVHALRVAFKERFGIDDDFHDIEIAGMTDSGIVLSILNKHKIPATTENVSGFLDSYVHFLSLELPRRKGEVLPVVTDADELLRRSNCRWLSRWFSGAATDHQDDQEAAPNPQLATGDLHESDSRTRRWMGRIVTSTSSISTIASAEAVPTSRPTNARM